SGYLERNIFGDILEREDDGEVNQPLPSSRHPSIRGTDKVGGGVEKDVVVEEGEVNSARSPDEWIAQILSGLRDPFEACISDARRESPSPIKED
ncbi:unnamed protein product, partial [Citrullus colocynthis]